VPLSPPSESPYVGLLMHPSWDLKGKRRRVSMAHCRVIPLTKRGLEAVCDSASRETEWLEIVRLGPGEALETLV
jgi:hypothetical protein